MSAVFSPLIANLMIVLSVSFVALYVKRMCSGENPILKSLVKSLTDSLEEKKLNLILFTTGKFTELSASFLRTTMNCKNLPSNLDISELLLI